MHRAPFIILYYNQQMHNYIIKVYTATVCAIYTSSHFDIFASPSHSLQPIPCKLHTFFKLQLLEIQFIKLICFTSFYDSKCALVGYNKELTKTVKTFLGPLEPCLNTYEICPTCPHLGLQVFPSSKPQHWNETFNNT
jgi:hypothetical protein